MRCRKDWATTISKWSQFWYKTSRTSHTDLSHSCLFHPKCQFKKKKKLPLAMISGPKLDDGKEKVKLRAASIEPQDVMLNLTHWPQTLHGVTWFSGKPIYRKVKSVVSLVWTCVMCFLIKDGWAVVVPPSFNMFNSSKRKVSQNPGCPKNGVFS